MCTVLYGTYVYCTHHRYPLPIAAAPSPTTARAGTPHRFGREEAGTTPASKKHILGLAGFASAAPKHPQRPARAACGNPAHPAAPEYLRRHRQLAYFHFAWRELTLWFILDNLKHLRHLQLGVWTRHLNIDLLSFVSPLEPRRRIASNPPPPSPSYPIVFLPHTFHQSSIQGLYSIVPHACRCPSREPLHHRFYRLRMHSSGYERLHDQRSLDVAVMSSGIDTLSHSGSCKEDGHAALPRRRSSNTGPDSAPPQQHRAGGSRFSPPVKPGSGLTGYIVEHQIRRCPKYLGHSSFV